MSNHPYIELRTRSAFSFLEGAALPEDLVARAAELGYPALALGDRDGLYGAPRFYHAAVKAGLKAIVGAELTLEDESRLYVLVPDRERYKNLCRMITASKLRPVTSAAGILAPSENASGATVGLECRRRRKGCRAASPSTISNATAQA